jgi:hypothetical protein
MHINRREAIKMLTAAYLSANWVPTLSGADLNDYRGIFAIGRAGKLNLEKAALLPFVDGICLRSKWKIICPSEGKMNIDYFNEGFNLAAKYNKKVTIWVTPGVSTPEWVYSRGARSINVKYNDRILKVPVPWNKVYLKLWFDFVSNLADLIRNKPNLKNVVVTVAHFKSSEFHLPGKLTGLNSYSPNKILGIWKDAIDHFAMQFPWQFLTTHSTIAIMRNKTLPNNIVLHGARVYSGRFGTQMNNFKERMGFKSLNRLKRLSREMPVGLQAACYFGAKKPGGDLYQALDVGFNVANARYFELYGPNIIRLRQRKALQKFYPILKNS